MPAKSDESITFRVIDHVIWGGVVANPGIPDPDTVALRSLNQSLHQDQRIELSMLPIADRLTLALKRDQ